MPLSVMADAELVVTTYLRNRAEVFALVGTQVSTQLPPTPVYPLLWVRLAVGSVAVPRRLDAPIFDVWAMATTKAAARLVAATAQAALVDSGNATNNGGVITGADTVLGLTWVGDEQQPTYRFSSRVYVRPA